MEDADLPKALIKRIAKTKLAELDAAAGRADGREVQISKDALMALSESARVFINYLTATGNDICKEAKRQIISLEDVLTALEDLEFSEVLPPLKESMEVFKAENKEKSKKRAEQQKKRKLEETEAQAAAAATAAQAAAAQAPPPAHTLPPAAEAEAPVPDPSAAGAAASTEPAQLPHIDAAPSSIPSQAVQAMDIQPS